MLNFIIAEVSNSYQTVKDSIESITNKERARLVLEAEDFITEDVKKQRTDIFPKYFVTRKIEVE